MVFFCCHDTLKIYGDKQPKIYHMVLTWIRALNTEGAGEQLPLHPVFKWILHRHFKSTPNATI